MTFYDFMFWVFIGMVSALCGIPLAVLIAVLSYDFIIEPIYKALSPSRRRTKKAQAFLDQYAHNYYWRRSGQMRSRRPR